MEQQEQILFSLPLPRYEPIFKKWVREAMVEVMTKNQRDSEIKPNQRITRKEVKETYRISYPTIHKLMHEGLPFLKIGRKTVFRVDDIENFLEERKGRNEN